MSKFRHAIVIGASSGIGAEIARQLAATGAKVAAIARRAPLLEALAAEHPGQILPYPHDVRNYEEIPGLFQEITRELGGLDLVVYATGVMPSVRRDEFDFEKDRAIFETNVLGMMAWLDQAALRFQGTRHGAIVGIGSVAGERGRPGQPAYNASKAAMHTYLESLRNRLDRLGVSVVTIKPGPTETELIAHLEFKNPDSASRVAQLTLAKAGRSGEYFVRLTHKLAFLVLRNIPSPIFRRLDL